MEQLESSSRRRIHYDIPGHAHLLTFSCYHRKLLLREERFCQMLAESLTAALEKHLFDLWAYVFMPEHVHLLVWPKEEPYRIASFLQSVKLAASKKWIRCLRSNCPEKIEQLETGQVSHPYRVWQAGGGHDRNLHSRRALYWARSYIHENPVRKGFVENPLHWQWSSARSWQNPEQGPISVDRESFPL